MNGRVERNPQYLPVPLGELAPAHVSRRRSHKALRLRAAVTVTTVGVIAGVIGVALLGFTAPVTAYLAGNRVEIGTMTLTRVGPVGTTGAVLYQGDASYVLSERGDGTASAAAAWTDGGRLVSGACTMRPGGRLIIDECTFDTGNGVVSAIDVLNTTTGGGWQRTYGDGVRVVIDVPRDGAAVPVPFPLGR